MQEKPTDPVAVWASAAPKPVDEVHPFSPVDADDAPSEWQWGRSKWIGIHYGPIPVGLIIGVPLLIALASR